VAAEGGSFDPPRPVDPEVQPAAGRDGRVELAYRPGGRVPGVGERRLPGALPAAVERGQVGLVHVRFSPYFQPVGGDGNAERDVADRAQVRRDVLAPGAVAPRGAADVPSALVEQLHGQPVDLRLGDVAARVEGAFRDVAAFEEPADAPVELPKLLFREGVGEGEHRDVADDGAERIDRLRADALRGGFGVELLGMLRLEGDELAEEGVVLRVGHLRRVVPVVPVVVVPDQPPEFLDAVPGAAFHVSSSAAMPGSRFPSSSSRKAPPPVETYDIRENSPAL